MIEKAVQEEKGEFEELPTNLIQKAKKYKMEHKLMIGSIETGGIFGEEEIVNNTKRKYTAISSAAMTVLYVLKKRVFSLSYEIFLLTLPKRHFVNYLRNIFHISPKNSRHHWRQNPIGEHKECKKREKPQL